MNLPEGWALSEIGELGEIITGKTPSTKVPENFGGSIPFIKPGDLDHGGYIHSTADTLTELGLPSVPKLPPHSITVTCIGNLGKIGITTTESATNQQINSVVPSRHLNYKFLYHYLATLKPWLEQEASATTVAIINKGKFSRAPIKVAPLAEQHQIAAKLDELLAQVDSIKARLDAIPKILKRFRQSVLAAAVSGKLTEDWREKNLINDPNIDLLDHWLLKRKSAFDRGQQELINSGKIKNSKKFKDPIKPDLDTRVVEFPQTWKTVSVSQFAECLDHIRIPIKKDDRKNASGLYPYFGANGEVDRIDEYLFDDDLVMVTEDETFYGREKPIAYRYSGKCWVNNHAHVLRAPTKDANDFLFFTLMFYDVIPWLSGTTGRAKLTQAALNSLPMGLPPEKEQTEIVRRLEQLFAYADQIEQRVKDAQARVNHLTQAILAKTFRGELTADWRAQNPELISGENSAEALLAKIQTERPKEKPRTDRKARA